MARLDPDAVLTEAMRATRKEGEADWIPKLVGLDGAEDVLVKLLEETYAFLVTDSVAERLSLERIMSHHLAVLRQKATA